MILQVLLHQCLPLRVDVPGDAGNAKVVTAGQRAALERLAVATQTCEADLVGELGLTCLRQPLQVQLHSHQLRAIVFIIVHFLVCLVNLSLLRAPIYIDFEIGSNDIEAPQRLQLAG